MRGVLPSPSTANRRRSSATHSKLYVKQAMPRGGRTSSAAIRASFTVKVLVLPLPGPASMTQLPVDS